MGVAYYGNYLAFFETGRVEAMRQIGADYGGVVKRGVHLPVVEAHVRYHQPTFFDDLLLIHTRADDIRGARFTFTYEVVRAADDVCVATGHTVHAVVDATTMRPTRIPEWLQQGLASLQ